MTASLRFLVAQAEDGEVEVAPVAEDGHEGEAEVVDEGVHAEAEEEVKNPILPTGNEMFWGAVTFFLLWALLKWVLLPPIMKLQQERADVIRGDRDRAEQARDEAVGLRRDYEAGLASARTEASRIIDDARHAGEEKRRQLVAAAEAEIGEDRARAASEVEAAKAVAFDELRSGVTGLAVEAARLVVQKELDETVQRPVVEEYVNRAGTLG